MAQEYSFDVVSEVDRNEVRNAVNLASKEIATRYDFKKSVSKVALEGDDLVLVSDNEGKLRSVIDLLEEKLVRRKVPLKALQYGKVEAALGGTVRQRFKKLRLQVQGDAVRVFSPKKDELQAAMQALRDEDFGIPLQFTNYR